VVLLLESRAIILAVIHRACRGIQKILIFSNFNDKKVLKMDPPLQARGMTARIAESRETTTSYLLF